MKFHQKFRGTQFHRIIHWNTHLAFGKGFSRSNLNYMLFFTSISQFVKIDDPLERSFYQQQAIYIEKLIYT